MDAFLPIIIAVIVFSGFCLFTWKMPGWGLVLMPFMMTGIIISGIVLNDVVIFTIGIVLFPATIGIVRWAPQSSPLETPWYKTVAKAVMLFFQYLFILFIMGYAFNVFGGLLFILLVIGIVRYYQVCKYSLSLEIITTIGMSMRQSLPLPMSLTTAAYGQKYKTAKIFNHIAYWLTQGYSLSESIRRGCPKFPPELLATITVAEKMNQLPNAIETIRADIAEKIDDYKKLRPVHPWYPIFVLLIMFFILLGLMYFIVPTFAEVLSDMSDGMAGLPWLTQQLLNFANWLKGRHGLNILVLLILFLWFTLYLTYVRFRKRNPESPKPLSVIGDYLKWHLPVLHWFEANYSQLQLTEILKIGLRAGYPVNLSVRNALGLNMNQCYRNRISKWLVRIEAGDSLVESASQCGIGRTLAWALDGSINKGNTSLILETLEELYRSRYNYRLNLLNAVLCPLMVIGLGICVGLVVLGMFLPMVKMIEVML